MSVSRRFQFAWYAQHLLGELVLIYPVAAIMMSEHGVGPLDLSLLFALWSLAVVSAEVPTGALADRVSRRRLLIVSRLVKGCCFLTWWVLPGFWGYLAGFVCWGVASTLRSGTAESVLHDTLSAAGAPEQFEQIYGRAAAAGHVGLVASFLAGGLLAGRVGFGIPLALSVVGPWLAAIAIAAGVADPPRGGSARARNEAFRETLRAGLREARSSVRLLHVIGMTATIACIWEVFEEYLPVYLLEKGTFTLGAIGVTFACASGATIAAAAAAHRLPFRSLRAIAVAFGVAGALLLASTVAAGVPAAALLIASAGVNGAAGVLLAGRLQRSIRGHARATVTSVAGMGQEVVGILLYMAVGAGAGMTDWHGGVGLLGVLALVLCIGFVAAPARS
ncbi:MAG: MFS transporter [Acidobacteria bacterium]|nr:MFS transporter [Acidobacteriota bacterium]